MPAWILGLSTAQGLWVILRGYLKNTINTDVSLLLAPIAIMVATILGLIVPIVAAILPIRKALTTNLHDALDRRR